MILTIPLVAKLLEHQCWYHLSMLKWASIQDEWSVQQLEPSTLTVLKMPSYRVYLFFCFAHSPLSV